MIIQLSVVLENKPGKLSRISDLLGREGVNIRAISVAENADMSTVRFVVDDPKKAKNIFKTHGYNIMENGVIAVETPDHPGGLNAVLKPLREADINVQYLYPFIGRSGDNAVLIMGVDKPNEAIEVMKGNWLHILDKEVYTL